MAASKERNCVWCVVLDRYIQSFSPDVSQRLEKLYQEGGNIMDIDVGGKKYILSIDMFWQQNSETGFRRPILARPNNASVAFATTLWFIHDKDKDTWTNMDSDTSYQLSTWPETRNTSNIVPCGGYNRQRNYIISLDMTRTAGTQTNLLTGVVSDIIMAVSKESAAEKYKKHMTKKPVTTHTDSPVVFNGPYTKPTPDTSIAETDPFTLLNQASIPYTTDIGKQEEDTECPVCLEPLCGNPKDIMKPIKLAACEKHYFHASCVALTMHNGSIRCPICGFIYGAPLTGNQPDNGIMSVFFVDESLPGFDCGTIVIEYRFSDGKQGNNHPRPGETYQGTSRVAYLPNNPDGTNALALLKVAWDRRLIFTVNHSVTFGVAGGIRVVWNGIHHKTSPEAGEFGYPDPTYFIRLKDELARVGVTDKDLEQK